MNIVVLLKQTFDTEEKIVVKDGCISDEGVKFIVNPYDEYAIEEALRLKENAGSGTVTVITVGPERCAEALRTALAMGADEAVHICDPLLGEDERTISTVLAVYLKSRPIDILLGGNFAVDTGAGQIALRVAALLDLPHVGAVIKLVYSGDGKVTAHRDAEGSTELVETSLPALFTAQQGLNEPRYATLAGIVKAKKKPFNRLTLDDIGVDRYRILPSSERIGIELPPVRKTGTILQGDPAEQVKRLVRLLDEDAKVLPE